LALCAAGIAWSAAGSAGAADSLPPSITKLKATPSHFCVKRKKQHCRHLGTTVHFKTSTAAKVRGDLSPRRGTYRGSFVEFVKHFPRGRNSIHVQDKRLTTGRWTLRLQGMNSVGSGNITQIDVYVVKKKRR